MKQKRVGFSKLSEFRRQEAVKGRRESAMLSQLTPTQIALLFPDYFKRGTPDIGGFREAISRATAEQQQQLLKTLSDKTGVDPSTGKDFGSIPASGNLKQNQQEAYKAARAEGLSDKAARALVANMSGEGLANPGAFNRDYNSRGEFVHMARGIVQWDPPRSEAIKRNFGKYPNEMTVAEQTKAAIWEMKTNPNYAPTWAALNDPNASSQDMIEKLVRNYERSAHQDADIERRMGYLGGLKVDESGTATVDRTQQGATPPTGGAGQTATPSVQTEGQAPSAEVSYENRGGYLAPKNRNMYSAGNVEQCATLTKAFADVGRSSSWKVERVDPGMIKPGTPIASLKYNEDGPDKTHAGYHTGIALTAPNEKGDVMILHQWAGSGGAKIGWVNINSYHNGETSFGLIRSEGKLHSEQSMEALKYASQIATPEQKKLIETNMNNASEGKSPVSGSPSEQTAGPQAPPGAEGMPMGGQAGPTADLMQPMQMMQNLMGMAMGQSADPIGLVMPIMNMIMPMLGGGIEAIAGPLTTGIMQGEGMGGPGGPTVLPKINVRVAHQGTHGHRGAGVRRADPYSPNVTASGLNSKSNLVEHTSIHAAPAIGATQEQYNAFREAVASIESRGGNYNLRGGSSNRFSGAYQMGGGEIREIARFLGEQAPVARLPGSRKIAASDQFLNDPKMQERYFDAYVLQHHNYLMNKNKKYAAMSPEDRLKILGYAHNQGAGGANKWLKTGASKADAFGTDATKYSYRIGRQFEGMKVAQQAGSRETQLADVTPSVRSGQVGPTTPPTPAMQAPSQKALFDLMTSRRGQAEPSQVTPAPSTNIPRTPVTPGSMSISQQPAPQIPISRQARNPLGIYSRPSSRDMMYGFAKGENVSKTQLEGVTNVGRATPASTTPDSNTTQTATPVTPSQRQLRNLPTFAKFDTSNMASVSPYVGVGATPGPVPDRTSGQMAQIRDQMRTISEMATSQAGKERQMPEAAPTKVEHAPAIAVPPSYERAVGRSHQEENKTRAADNVHSYGNYRE